MAADLTHVFSFITSVEDSKGTEIEPSVFGIRGELTVLSGEKDHIFIVVTNNTTSVRVDKFVSDKYLKTFEWMDANPSMVKKAHQFVKLLNSEKLRTQSHKRIVWQICHVSMRVRLEILCSNNHDEIKKLVEPFLEWKYLEFSALNFSKEEVQDLEGTEEKPAILLFMVLRSDPSEGFAFPCVFHKGKWGFGGYISRLQL